MALSSHRADMVGASEPSIALAGHRTTARVTFLELRQAGGPGAHRRQAAGERASQPGARDRIRPARQLPGLHRRACPSRGRPCHPRGRPWGHPRGCSRGRPRGCPGRRWGRRWGRRPRDAVRACPTVRRNPEHVRCAEGVAAGRTAWRQRHHHGSGHQPTYSQLHEERGWDGHHLDVTLVPEVPPGKQEPMPAGDLKIGRVSVYYS